jgi:hypothetical protein
LSGQVGTVESFTALKGTYSVRLSDSRLATLKPEDVCSWYSAATKVILYGLPHAQQLDGQLAKVDGWDNGSGRYLVHLVKNKKRTSLLRSEHLRTVFKAGSMVKFDGLVTATELNGQFGKVIRFDDGCGRYMVRLCKGGDTKRIRPEQLFEPLPGEAPQEKDDENQEVAKDAGDASSVDSGDLLGHLPAPASPALSSSSSSSESIGRPLKRRRQLEQEGATPKFKLPRVLLRSAVEKNMKAGQKDVAAARQHTSFAMIGT